MNEAFPITDLQKLQIELDKTVSKIGISKTVYLLKSFNANSTIEANEKAKVKLITAFIIAQSITIFNLKESEFYTSEIREYREARMACYHLLYVYTKCSYPKIGELFDRKKRNVQYFCNKCQDLLSIPQFYRGFTEKYNALDQCTIAFIGKL